MNIYDKARLGGCEERHIQLAQQEFVPSMLQQHIAIHDAHARVLIHAKSYDHPGQSVVIDWFGIGIHV